MKDIKMILCDMDGTLLNSEKKLPNDFEEVFVELEEKGITLGIASGRPLSCMKERFPKLHKRMVVIAENGACVYYKGDVIHLEKIDKELCDKTCEKVRSLPACSLVLCALNGTYIEDNYDYLIEACKEYYPDLKKVDNLLDVEDSILKMSVRDYEDTKTNTIPAFNGFDERMDYAASGKYWLDIMRKGVSKGKGIDVLCQYLHITPDQIMAFGDHFNDYEMLKKVTHSYAMENAEPEIKQICAHVCESCDDDGVMKTIKRELLD